LPIADLLSRVADLENGAPQTSPDRSGFPGGRHVFRALIRPDKHSAETITEYFTIEVSRTGIIVPNPSGLLFTVPAYGPDWPERR
jgi:hypothetical protein